jgi:hypothetical protein
VAEIVPDTMIQVSQVHTASAPLAKTTSEHVVVKPSGSRDPGPGQSATIAPLRTHVIPKTCPAKPVQEVDLVASDWFGGETDCAPLINGCRRHRAQHQ